VPQRLKRWRAVLFLWAIWGASLAGLGAELHVPGDYPTITGALAVAADGDRIRVVPGTYSVTNGETFPLRLSKAVTLEAAPGGKPHLRGDQAHTVVLIEAGGVTVRGFRITEGNGSEGINLMDGGGVCVFVGASETNAVTIEDCLIEDNTCPSDETYDGCGGGIYCGGTYCTCFEIRIANCVIRQNSVRGDGGGVFCALLSNVKIENAVVEENKADDHGGGIFVDVFASAALSNTRLVLNNCPGDPDKANWGGKGGGLACESFGLFTATSCLFAQNTAKYFGGGIFTRGGLFSGESLCSEHAQFPQLSDSLVASNRAGFSGGGAYVASGGVLEFSRTTNYWNDAGQDGGAVFVAGGSMGGAEVRFGAGCLLEGNECAGQGGAVYLGQNANGLFQTTRFLGNSSLFDGGALFLQSGAATTLTNCLLTYNNSARGYGGGLRLLPGARVDLLRCSVVGNFALRGRSGLVLSTNATVAVANSILWRNAGGSVQSDGGRASIASSLSEDGALPAQNVMAGSPGYVGWGAKPDIYVDGSFTNAWDGTAANPFPNLQLALDGYDFRLATNSPCLGAASDGGNLGAATGVGGAPGNITATLRLTNGLYDIRGRSVIFTRGLVGAGATNSLIRHSVFGYVEDTFIRDLGITAEEIFGGIVTRANARFENSQVAGNTALADGGGIYVAEGQCLLTNTLVLANQGTWNGGGLFLAANTGLTLDNSSILANRTLSAGRGGGVYASALTSLWLTNSLAAHNASAGDGGMLYLSTNSLAVIALSQVSSNTAPNGGGAYIAGRLHVRDSVFVGNRAENALQPCGGAIYVKSGAIASLFQACISSNYAGWVAGGIMCLGAVQMHDSLLETNKAAVGGALYIDPPGSLSCSNCQFFRNVASLDGGVLHWASGTSPVFTECEFVGNSANWGGVAKCWYGGPASFVACRFQDNSTFGGGGGCFLLEGSQTRFRECVFNHSDAKLDGGAVFCYVADSSLFEGCSFTQSTACGNGGAFFIAESAQPVLSNVRIVESRAAKYGGGIGILGTAKPYFAGLTISSAQAIYGGGVFAGGQSQSVFRQCEFRDNRAYELTTSADGGGAFFTEDARAWFTRCVFQGNTAQDDGGCMGVAENARIEVWNTLLAGNTAVDDGGGIHFTSQGAGTFTNCTIVLNTSIHGGTGGGLYLETNSTVRVDSSILWQNRPDGIRREATPSVSYSCVQEAWPGPDNLLTNPLLDPVTFGLQDASPGIDAGNPDPAMNDACIPPGKGTTRNDIGFTGGPENCVAVYQGQFDFPTFTDPVFLVLRGSALLTNGLLRLTVPPNGPVGGAWYALPVYVRAGFETSFEFRIDRDGADGFAFVIENTGLASLGDAGGGLGYRYIPNSLAVEFDTWGNGEFADPNHNHLSVQTRGINPNSPHHTNSLASTTSIPFLSDNRTHTARVTYVPGQLCVYVDRLETPHLTVPVDLENALSLSEGSAFVGFTAAFGSLVEVHDILRWSFVTATVLDGDADSDGLPDWWEETYSGSTTLTDRRSNLDRDPLLDWEEWVAGTDPTDPASVFGIAAVELSPGGMVLTWPSMPNRIYRVFVADALPPTWTEAIAILGDGSILTWTDHATTPGTGFYRLSVELP
jgi:hypothetical protein